MSIIFAVILSAGLLIGVSALNLSGPITSSLSSGRFTILDPTCGSIAIISDEQTVFRASGHALAGPNYAQILMNAVDCTSARTTAASHVALSATPALTITLLEIRMKGISGGERVELRIRDVTVAVWTLSTTWQIFSYRHTAAGLPVNIRDIKVAFVNDNEAPNLDVAVEYVSVDGQVFPTQAPDTYSVGSWSASSGCNPGFKNSMMLHCNGYFQFKVISTAAPTTSPATTNPVTPAPTTKPPTPAPTPPPATRDFTLQPFARTSIWNLPIGTGAMFESATSTRTTNLILTGKPWANEDTYSHPISYASLSDPLARVTDYNYSPRSATYNIPINATIAKGTDAHMHVISPDRRTIHETWAASRVSATEYRVGRHEEVDLQGDGIGPSDGTRAYGGSAIGGLIRAWEVDPTHPKYTGDIRHPLALALRRDQLLFTPGGGEGYDANGYMLQRGYIWPATEQDYDSPYTYSGSVAMGTYIAIPPSVNLTQLGLTPQGQMLGRAFQNYGAYVTDAAGDMMMAYVEPSPAGAVFASALLGPSWTAADLNKLRAQLRIVTNNGPTTPNAAPLGGSRRAPMLPV